MDEARFGQRWRSLPRSQQIEAGGIGVGEVMPTWMGPGVVSYFGPVASAATSPAAASSAGFVFPAEVHDLVHPAARTT